MKKILLAGLIPLSFWGCTSIQVNSIGQQHFSQITTVCIMQNPAVIVEDFVPVLEKRLQHHGIKTVVRSPNNSAGCTTQLQYSARQSWDGVLYLSWAELKLYQNGIPIGDAEYKLKGKGGLAPTKWYSVETKMTPVIDELLKNKGSQVNQPLQVGEQPLIPIKISN